MLFILIFILDFNICVLFYILLEVENDVREVKT